MTTIASLVSPQIPSPKNLILVSSDVKRSKSAQFLRLGRGISSSRLRPICRSQGDESFSAGENGSSSFCIIEGPETVWDFTQMQLQEIQDNIRGRRNKIFLLMEEVRRLRVQQRIKSAELIDEGSEENEMPDMPSTIPFIPNMTQKTLKQLYLTSFSLVSGIIVFGGLLAPIGDRFPTVVAFPSIIANGGYLLQMAATCCRDIRHLIK